MILYLNTKDNLIRLYYILNNNLFFFIFKKFFEIYLKLKYIVYRDANRHWIKFVLFSSGFLFTCPDGLIHFARNRLFMNNIHFFRDCSLEIMLKRDLVLHVVTDSAAICLSSCGNSPERPEGRNS